MSAKPTLGQVAYEYYVETVHEKPLLQIPFYDAKPWKGLSDWEREPWLKLSQAVASHATREKDEEYRKLDMAHVLQTADVSLKSQEIESLKARVKSYEDLLKECSFRYGKTIGFDLFSRIDAALAQPKGEA